MTSSINKAVPVRQGIILRLSQDENGVSGTIILSRNNHLSQLFNGRIAEALQRAERSALEYGFEGYYEISGEDDLTTVLPTDLGGMSAEIDRQMSVLRPKVGIRQGFNNPPWSAAELVAMPTAQAQLSRLMKLRDALIRKMLNRPAT